VAIAVPLVLGGTARAHTESDVIAVPTGSTAEVTLRPTHGCGDSPTTEVATRAPVEGAEAVAVPGWSHTATPDGDGTVLEWTGGSLPADQVGAFPIRFTVDDPPGELLTFPFVQVCESGEELAWIDGDPEGEFPAPRLLVLPVGSEPASTVDDVPPDAPGREQLVEIVDVDNPAAPATTTTTTATTTTSTTTGAQDEDRTSTPAPADDDDGSALPMVAVAVGAAAAAVLAVLVLRRRRAGSAT
jgi:uncharacterized protein YcnI